MAGQELINHYNGIKLAVEGVGYLRVRLLSKSGVKEVTLAPLGMSPLNDRHEFIKANFRQARVQVELKIIDIDEYFRIDKIVVYYKPVATSYPQ